MDAIKAAASSHTFLSVTKQGLSAIVETIGNDSTHVILRGSSKGPNYEAEHVEAAGEKLKKAGLPVKIMVNLKRPLPDHRHDSVKSSMGSADLRSTARTATRQSSTNARSLWGRISPPSLRPADPPPSPLWVS